MDDGLLHLGDVLDILELGFGANTVIGATAAQALEDISSFLFTVNLDQPAWGLGEEPDGAK